jgi:hypothetical protein
MSFLDSLCTALVRRDGAEIQRLLGHPMASTLPVAVRREAAELAAAGAGAVRAPVQTLHFAHQMAHLMGAIGDPATRTIDVRLARQRAAAQAELPLTARRPAAREAAA